MEPLNVTMVGIYVMLVLPNVTLALSNVRKQIIKLLNVIKLRAYVMLVLSNVSKKEKKKEITECNKSTVICDISITQCDNKTI